MCYFHNIYLFKCNKAELQDRHKVYKADTARPTQGLSQRNNNIFTV